jgi:hypothetical protein
MKMNLMNTKIGLIVATLIVFLLGIVFIYQEGFENNTDATSNVSKMRCPNLLVQNDKDIYLFNTKLKEIPGVNPIRFNNLEEYNEFLNWQKSQGIICPILFLQKTYDAQGQTVFTMRPSVNDQMGGLQPSIMASDGTVVRSTLGEESFAYAYLPEVLHKTPYDIHNSAEIDYTVDGKSPHATDPNWGGIEFSDKLIELGFYKDNVVSSK